MKQLSGLDASFLYMETGSQFGHVSSLSIYERPDDPSYEPLSSWRHQIERRLHFLEPLRRRLLNVPFNLDHPYWVDDPGFDLDFHVRHTAVAPPGDDEQIAELEARIIARPLDRSRPLWQYYVIEGLESGGFAIYIKMHHAGIDGGAGMAALPIIFATSPDPEPVQLPSPTARDSRPPELFEMIRASYDKFFTQQREFYQSWPDIGKAIAKVGQRVTEDLANPPRLLPIAPKTLFNASLSSQRSFATCTISLREAKAVAKLTKSKLNDVVMTVSAGALRRYLETRNALPDGPLIAAVPVSLRKAGNADMNNQVTAMLCNLATDIADPIRRLEAIVASSSDSKKRLEDIRDVIRTDMTWLGAPIIITGMARLMGQAKLAEQLPAIVNVLISNVPGPRETLYCAGARMINYFPVSIPSNGSVLNLTVQSYMDNLDFGLIACRTAVSDIEKLVDFLVDEFGRLKKAASGGEPKVKKIEIREAKAARRSA